MIKSFQTQHPKIHETAFVAADAIVIGDVEIGEQSSVWFGSIVRGDVNHIRIGARSMFRTERLFTFHRKLIRPFWKMK